MTEQNENEIWQEPDWEFINFVWDIEEEWQREIRMLLPKSEAGWLEVFPEAKEVIPAKIKEWEQKAESARLLVKEALRLIETKSAGENRWFWREIIKYTFPPVKKLAIAKRHIKRLKWAMPVKNKSKVESWKRLIERAKDTDIVRIAEGYGFRLKKSGKHFFITCPKHNERTPSFCLYPPTRFHCFGCQSSGDQIAFVQMMDNCSFTDAVRKLQ